MSDFFWHRMFDRPDSRIAIDEYNHLNICALLRGYSSTICPQLTLMPKSQTMLPTTSVAVGCICALHVGDAALKMSMKCLIDPQNSKYAFHCMHVMVIYAS